MFKNGWEETLNDFAKAQDGSSSEDSGGSKQYAQPLPLIRKLPEPEKFPVDALGSKLSIVTGAVQKKIQAPMELCAQCVLAAVNLATQAHADVTLDGRTFPISEFFQTVGESGERKTAVDREVLAPHREYEVSLAAGYEIDIEKYKKLKAIYEAEWNKAIKGNGNDRLNRLDNLPKRPEEPLHPLFITEEPTYEGLVKLLATGQPSIGLFADEGGRLIGGYSLSVENQLKTAAGLSELWDGRRISRVRAGDGNMLMYGRRVSMHIMAQPGVAFQFLGNPVLTDQGLLSRFLISFPSSTVGTRLYREPERSGEQVMLAYSAKILEILTTRPQLAEGSRNQLDPRKLRLSPAAKALWISTHDVLEKQLPKEKRLGVIRGFGNKAAEHALRLAGTLCLYENLEATELSDVHVGCGIQLVQYYLSEALRLHYAAAVDPELEVAVKVLEWLKGQTDGVFHLAQLYQFGPSGVRDRKSALSVIDVLENHHWLRRLPDGSVVGGAKRKDAWEVAIEPSTTEHHD